MQKLEDIARSITWFDILKTADVKLWTSGLLGGDRVTELLSTHLGDLTFDDIAKPFGVVAADLANDKEILIRSGPLVEALRATISLPGIFEPVVRDDAVLIDGGRQESRPRIGLSSYGGGQSNRSERSGRLRGHRSCNGSGARRGL